MIRAVLDINVLASGFLGSPSGLTTPTLLLHQWRSGQFTLVISEYILAELQRTLADPYFATRIRPEDRASFLIFLTRVAERTVIRQRIAGVATHPEDDPILATALAGRADYLVTGDRRLRDRVPSFQGIPLISPSEFRDVLNRES
jgi:uncharacterized protein